MKSFLQLKFIPLNPSFALLLLRVWLGATMFGLHGLPKLHKLGAGDLSFSNPLGIGAAPTFVLAVTCEVLGSLLLILGFMGRFAALLLAFTMAVAWTASHGMRLSGIGGGELAFIYLAGFLTIVFAGTGKYGIDKA